MAEQHASLLINRQLSDGLRRIRSSSLRDEDARTELGDLLQSALALEFATIPPYLSAAFSLRSNNQIFRLIMRTAIEEMLHMTAVANLMNAIGVAPDIVKAVPKYPYDLTVLDPPLKLNLKSFSFDLVKSLFMQIERPEYPVVYSAAERRSETIGEFYAGIIEIISSDAIGGLFKDAVRDVYKQIPVKPVLQPIAYTSNSDTGTYPLTGIDFIITDKASAVRHLSWVVDQGEGAEPLDPLTMEGLPGHYYRFESILHGRYLIKDPAAPSGLGHSHSGGDLPFDETGVHEFDDNAKAADYPEAVAAAMRNFDVNYTRMINALQLAFNCPAADQQEASATAYEQAKDVMKLMLNDAAQVKRKARQNNVKAGLSFDYQDTVTS